MAAMLSLGGSNLRALMRPMGFCRPTTRRHACIALASKGFGDSQAGRSSGEDDRRQVKRRRVNIRREEAPIPNQGNSQTGSSGVFADVKQLEDGLMKSKDDEDFAARLAMVRQEGQEKRRELKASGGTPGAAPATPGAVFEGAPAEAYANPPSLTSTLMNQLNSDVSDPKLKEAQFGPNQIAVAISALVFGLIFVLVSGADFAPSKRYQGVQPSGAPPDALEASLIKGRIAQLENARQANPNDLEALEGLAVSYAQLFEFEKAAGLLDQLVAARPNSAEAWRLLGETTLLSQQPARSVAAYEKAAALSSDDLQVLTGLADAYIANAEQGKAIAFLTKLKASAATSSVVAATAPAPAAAPTAAPEAPAVDTTAEPAPVAEPVSADASAASTAVSADASTEGSAPESSIAPVSQASSVDTATATAAAASTSAPSTTRAAKKNAAPASPASSVDAAALDLLTAKVYSRWRGHDADALATYDALIQRTPDDFRGYLAKGLFLKERGQKADAERMFIQVSVGQEAQGLGCKHGGCKARFDAKTLGCVAGDCCKARENTPFGTVLAQVV